jgi:hypothetical protein
MAKRKQSKSAARKGAKVGASKGRSVRGERLAKVGASTTVTALFEETRRRIKEIEKRALARRGGKDTDR